MDPEIRATMLKALSELGADWKDSADEALRQFEVTKHVAYRPVSDELLMDEGLVPDTRPPAPAPPWWWRARRAVRDRIGRARLRVGSWIAGQDLDPDQYEEW